MIKKMKFKGKEYNLKPNARTPLLYREYFSSNIFDDYSTFMDVAIRTNGFTNELLNGKSEKEIKLKGKQIAEDLEILATLTPQFIYVFLERESRPPSYEDFLENIDGVAVGLDELVPLVDIFTENFMM